MSHALQELASFTDFAQRQLSGRDSTLSLEDCIRLWRRQSESQATIADIRQGQADFEAGLSQPLAEAVDEVRRRLGLNCSTAGSLTCSTN